MPKQAGCELATICSEFSNMKFKGNGSVFVFFDALRAFPSMAFGVWMFVYHQYKACEAAYASCIGGQSHLQSPWNISCFVIFSNLCLGKYPLQALDLTSQNPKVLRGPTKTAKQSPPKATASARGLFRPQIRMGSPSVKPLWEP